MNAQPKPQCQLHACTRAPTCKKVCWYAQIQHGRTEHYRIRRLAKQPPSNKPKGWGWA